MKRRDFVKAFGAISVAAPIATALARADGSKSIIETFQMSDIEYEPYKKGTLYLGDKKIGEGTLEVSFNKETEFSNMPTTKTYFPVEKNILVLSPNFNVYQDFIHNYTHIYNQLNNARCVTKKEHLFGFARESMVIGLYNWWEVKGIPEQIYIREMVVLRPDQYFRSL